MVAHASVLSFTVLNFIAVYIQTYSYIIILLWFVNIYI